MTREEKLELIREAMIEQASQLADVGSELAREIAFDLNDYEEE